MALPVKSYGSQKPAPYQAPAPGAGGSTNPGDWFATQKPQGPPAQQSYGGAPAQMPTNEGQNQWDFYSANAPKLAATAGAGMGGMKAPGANASIADQIKTQLGPRPLDTPDAYGALSAAGGRSSGAYGGTGYPVGGQRVTGGTTQYSGGSPEEFEADMARLNWNLGEESAARRRGWSMEDEQRMLALLDPYLKGNTAPPARESYPGVDATAARTAEFARAADRTGEMMGGAYKALQDQLASRGMVGSGMQGALEGDIRRQGAGQLGEVIRDQAIQGANAAESRAGAIYSGNITQRGQDISAAAQRQQLLPSLMALIRQGYSRY